MDLVMGIDTKDTAPRTAAKTICLVILIHLNWNIFFRQNTHSFHFDDI